MMKINFRKRTKGKAVRIMIVNSVSTGSISTSKTGIRRADSARVPFLGEGAKTHAMPRKSFFSNFPKVLAFLGLSATLPACEGMDGFTPPADAGSDAERTIEGKIIQQPHTQSENTPQAKHGGYVQQPSAAIEAVHGSGGGQPSAPIKAEHSNYSQQPSAPIEAEHGGGGVQPSPTIEGKILEGAESAVDTIKKEAGTMLDESGKSVSIDFIKGEGKKAVTAVIKEVKYFA